MLVGQLAPLLEARSFILTAGCQKQVWLSHHPGVAAGLYGLILLAVVHFRHRSPVLEGLSLALSVFVLGILLTICETLYCCMGRIGG